MTEGEPPARVLPLFGFGRKFTLSCAFCAWGISLTAVSDQGLCPWTLVAFEKAPQNFSGAVRLENKKQLPRKFYSEAVCVYQFRF